MRILLLGGASELGLAIVGELMADQPADVVLAGRPGSRHREAAIESIREAGAASVRWLDFDVPIRWHPAVIQAASTSRRT